MVSDLKVVFRYNQKHFAFGHAHRFNIAGPYQGKLSLGLIRVPFALIPSTAILVDLSESSLCHMHVSQPPANVEVGLYGRSKGIALGFSSLFGSILRRFEAQGGTIGEIFETVDRVDKELDQESWYA